MSDPASKQDGRKPLSFSSLTSSKQQHRVQEEYMALHHVDMERGLKKDEFKTARTLENKPKNRYSDVLANERTIFPPPSTGLYINANQIDLRSLGDFPHRFVAAQAPCEEYIGEWWRVMHDAKATLLMMLTQEVENGVSKADRYWPEKQGQTEQYGLCEVTLMEEDRSSHDNIIIRKMQVLVEGQQPAHALTHVQYCGWPDHGVPSQPDAFNRLVQLVMEAGTGAPVIVHCSAGIGRTGTLIAVYAAIALARQGRLCDDSIFEIVKLLKHSRTGSVQRLEQYAFIYKSIETFLKQQQEQQLPAMNVSSI